MKCWKTNIKRKQQNETQMLCNVMFNQKKKWYTILLTFFIFSFLFFSCELVCTTTVTGACVKPIVADITSLEFCLTYTWISMSFRCLNMGKCFQYSYMCTHRMENGKYGKRELFPRQIFNRGSENESIEHQLCSWAERNEVGEKIERKELKQALCTEDEMLML